CVCRIFTCAFITFTCAFRAFTWAVRLGVAAEAPPAASRAAVAAAAPAAMSRFMCRLLDSWIGAAGRPLRRGQGSAVAGRLTDVRASMLGLLAVVALAAGCGGTEKQERAVKPAAPAGRFLADAVVR